MDRCVYLCLMLCVVCWVLCVFVLCVCVCCVLCVVCVCASERGSREEKGGGLLGEGPFRG